MTTILTATEAARQIIEQDFSRIPFTARDVTNNMFGGEGNVVTGRFPKRRRIEDRETGDTWIITEPSTFDYVMKFVVIAMLTRSCIYDDEDDLAIKLLDGEGKPLYLHTPPRHIDPDLEFYDYSDVTFFHRDIATPQQLIDYGNWMRQCSLELS
jgi:hypothetical protein